MKPFHEHFDDQFPSFPLLRDGKLGNWPQLIGKTIHRVSQRTAELRPGSGGQLGTYSGLAGEDLAGGFTTAAWIPSKTMVTTVKRRPE